MLGLFGLFGYNMFFDRFKEAAIFLACLLTSVVCFTFNELHQYKETEKTVVTRAELTELKRFKEAVKL